MSAQRSVGGGMDHLLSCLRLLRSWCGVQSRRLTRGVDRVSLGEPERSS